MYELFRSDKVVSMVRWEERLCIVERWKAVVYMGESDSELQTVECMCLLNETSVTLHR